VRGGVVAYSYRTAHSRAEPFIPNSTALHDGSARQNDDDVVTIADWCARVDQDAK
jgi:hypothetical protein